MRPLEKYIGHSVLVPEGEIPQLANRLWNRFRRLSAVWLGDYIRDAVRR